MQYISLIGKLIKYLFFVAVRRIVKQNISFYNPVFSVIYQNCQLIFHGKYRLFKQVTEGCQQQTSLFPISYPKWTIVFSDKTRKPLSVTYEYY